jgi:uncharacterized protein (TIGR02058 family)
MMTISTLRKPIHQYHTLRAALHHFIVSFLLLTLVSSSANSAQGFQPTSSLSSLHGQLTVTLGQRHLHPCQQGPKSDLVVVMSAAAASTSNSDRRIGEPHVENVLFIECGFGNDSHGQDPTKAAVRACRNAIEFNSIPSIQRLVPNGYDDLKLDVILAVPQKYKSQLRIEDCADVFPYGSIRFQIQDGGMIAPSGIAIDRLGDKNDDMIVVCCAVTVGY